MITICEVRARLDEVLGVPRRVLAEMCAAGRVRVLRPREAHGCAILDGRPWIEAGWRVGVLGPDEDPRVLPEDLALPVLYGDEVMLLVDKPAGMVCCPGADHPAGTLANALRGLGVPLSSVEGALRPGIVHRLDGGTSGVLAIAKDDAAHLALAAQFRAHTAGRRYLALVRGEPAWDEQSVENRLGRKRAGRKGQGAVATGPAPTREARGLPRLVRGEGRRAVTKFRVLRRSKGFALVEAIPETGRKHQIRVHLAGLGHPLVGDTLYGGAPARHDAHRLGLVRTALHAAELSLSHPITGATIGARAPIPDDLRAAFNTLFGADIED